MTIFSDSAVSGNIELQQAGVNKSYRSVVNFVSGVTVTDDPGNNRANLVVDVLGNIDGGSPSSNYLSPTQIINGGTP